MFGFIVFQLKHVILLRTLAVYNTTILVISLHVAELPRHVQSINVMSSDPISPSNQAFPSFSIFESSANHH
jgi:hypothetical protein